MPSIATHVNAERGASTHGLLGPDALRHEISRHPIRSFVHLAVCQGNAVLGYERGTVRRAPHLFAEQIHERLARRQQSRVAVRKIAQEETTLLCVNDWKIRHSSRGVVHHAPEQRLEMAAHRHDTFRPEQRAAVLHAEFKPFPRLDDVNRHIEPAHLVMQAHGTHVDAGEGQSRLFFLLDDEHHVEERRPAQVARQPQFLDQPIEGIRLMVEGRRGLLPHAIEQRRETLEGGQPGPQRQRIDVEADLVFQIRMNPARHRTPDGEVCFSRVAVQQHVERREQCHEERRAMFSSKRAQRRSETRVEPPAQMIPAEALHGRTGSVGRQVKGGGRVLKPIAPELLMHSHGCRRQQPALPHGVVLVMDAQGRTARRPPATCVIVERQQFTNEDWHRPPVGDDVVDDDRESPATVVEPSDRRTDERRLPEVERLVRKPSGVRHERLFRNHAVVVTLQLEGGVVHNLLPGVAVDNDEACAQRLMPSEQTPERDLEGGDIEVAHEHEGGGDVVCHGAFAAHLAQDPQPSLSARQRIVRLHRRVRNRLGRRRIALGCARCQPGDGRIGEEVAERELDL